MTKSPGRWGVFMLAAGLGACAPSAVHPGPIAGAVPRSQDLGTTWLRTRLAVNPGRAALDTLLVYPDTVHVQVGHHVKLPSLLRVVGLTATGDTLDALIPVWSVAATGNDIAEISELGLRGLRPGSATLLVTPFLASPGRPVITRVPIRVRKG